MARIIIGTYMVRYPLGGNLSWALQYITGLKDLGHEVYVVEKYVHDDSCYDPVAKQMTNDCSYGIKTVVDLLRRFGLDDRWCFVSKGELYHGLDKKNVEVLFQTSDLFIENGSHGVWRDEIAASGITTAYIDVDPAFTQINFYHKKKAGRAIPEFDHYFTNGLNIGQPGNIIPTVDIEWNYIFNPVNLNLFTGAALVTGGAYSTIMNWKSYAEDATYLGVRYGHKDIEFEKFATLPQLVPVQLEMAVTSTPAGKEKHLRQLGWQVRNAQEVTFTYDLFLNYLSGCRGEFSVVKNMYAATCSGWFSDKSAAFLATGRPVILQETGFSQHLPTGLGLFAVKNVEEAQAAIEIIEENYPKHAHAARDIAAEYLDTRKVLRNFLQTAGL